MSKIVCPYCGYDFRLDPREAVVTCPSCGTSFTRSGEVIEEHLMGRVNYSIQDILEVFKEWALRKPETPDDLPLFFRLKDYKLVFYPFWVYSGNIVVNYTGHVKDIKGRYGTKLIEISGKEEESVETAIPASSYLHTGILDDFVFNVRGKVYFSNSYVRKYGGRILNSEITKDEAEKRAWSKVLNKIRERLSLRDISNIMFTNISGKLEGPLYVHEPFYIIRYLYRGREFTFIADASDSRIIHAYIPVGKVFRMLALAAGLATLGMALGLGLIGLILDLEIFAISSFLAFGILGLFILSKGIRGVIRTGESKPISEKEAYEFLSKVAF